MDHAIVNDITVTDVNERWNLSIWLISELAEQKSLRGKNQHLPHGLGEEISAVFQTLAPKHST